MAQVAANVIAQRRIEELADQSRQGPAAALLRGAAGLLRAAHDRRHPIAARGRLPRRGRHRGRRHRHGRHRHPRRGHRRGRPLHRRLLGDGPAGAGPDQLPLAVRRGVRLLPPEVPGRPGPAGERGRLPAGRGADEARHRARSAVPGRRLQRQHHHDPADRGRHAAGAHGGRPGTRDRGLLAAR